MTDLHGRPTAAELVAAVAEFLENDVRNATTGQVNFHSRVAANALRMVERELQDPEPGRSDVLAALEAVGYTDEAALAAAIRAGEFDHAADHPDDHPDDQAEEIVACLRTLVRHRLAAAHPGYDKQ
jgi:hypothetical protein